MTYVDGYVIPVPREGRAAYLDSVAFVWSVFRDHGALRMVENWADDLKPGTVASFRHAVQALPDEDLVYSWIVWSSKAARDAGNAAAFADPRFTGHQTPPPFDPSRMISGGFATIFDSEET